MAGVFAHSTTFNVTIATVLTPIAELTTITGLEVTADEIDVTSHESADGFREYVGGLRDAGSVSIEGNFIGDASQEALLTLLKSGDISDMTIVFPDSTATWTFKGFVTAFSTDAPMEDKLSFSATIKVTGVPTLA
jgi:predicted secreted protein